ncbi:gliding motility-associated C-terminal domain-containing protein, partial [Aquimarina sp. RZ0]|uniref:DUF7507 domain-containing protein n=1 Tax=Aquimarina sp. RZ0 TaxID=2607730 RepID=UPI001252A8CF
LSQPLLDITKTDSYVDTNANGIIDAGDTINYVFTVSNTGNVDLTGISVTDSGALITPVTTIDLAIGASDNSTYTGTYILTQENIDSGSYSNQAVASGLDPNNITVTDASDDPDDLTNIDPNNDGNPDDPTVFIIAPDGAISMTKAANIPADGSYDSVGEIITYTIEITNDGNVTLSNVLVTDPNADTITPSTIARINPGETVTAVATHIINQTDIDMGSVTNVAQVTSEDPNGTPIEDLASDDPNTTDPDDPTITIINQAPAIELTKAADAPVDGDYDTVGELITYTIVVTNTGNTTLDNIIVSDANADIGSINPAIIATLEPGASTVVTASHMITEADLNVGSVTNVAQVTSEDPQGNPVEDLMSDDPSTPDPDDPTIVVMIDMNQSMAVTKAADTDMFSGVGDVITYTIQITNNGNVNLTNLVLTDDNATILSGTPIPNLMPGESTIVLAEHVVTAEDMISGQVINIASVTADDAAGTSITETSDDPNNPTDIDPDTDGDPDDPTISLLDSDGDGIPNIDDLDDDNDGITDIEEQNGDPNLDTDGDGVVDSQDLDADGDGVNDVIESGHGQIDLDGDGRLDGPFGDDGIPDIVQDDPDDGIVNYVPQDSDGDGTDDFQDVDDDGDGVDTAEENPDSDNDGDPNTGDTQDSDDDSIPDYLDTDDDGDGIDTIDENPNPDNDGDPDTGDTQDTDGDSTPDYLDDDDDGDGVDTSEEIDSDTDGNGPDDTDNDGTSDYLDIDDDNDGILTVDENPDPNGDGDPEDAIDTDGDGTPDYLDSNGPIDPDAEDGIQIFTGITPNGDGINDVFVINGIQNLENTLEIYNRWGVKVYDANNYGRNDTFFRGISNGRATVEEKDELPVGTYYYVLEYILTTGERKNRAGYLYINR